MPRIEGRNSLEILNDPDYIRAFNGVHSKFSEIVNKCAAIEQSTAGIATFSARQERLLTMALAIAMSPDVMTLSHCTHRAVSACLVQQFNFAFDPTVRQEILDTIKTMGRLGAIIHDEDENADTLIVVGVNNWFDNSQIRSFPESSLLNCKLMVGRPYEVAQDNLLHLAKGKELIHLEQVDLGCKKRTEGVDCNIIHAEESAYILSLYLQQTFGIQRPEKSYIVSSWVPCKNCVKLLARNKSLTGAHLDVISVYGAVGDLDDHKIASEIRGVLQKDGLGVFSGTYLGIPKEDGYGWRVTTPEWLTEVEEAINIKIPSQEGPRIMFLIKNALEVIRS